jgi:hypothetical protein
MSLSQQATHPRFPVPHYNKEVFHDETAGLEFVYQFNVGQPLLISADLVLAFDYVSAAVS